MFSLNRKPAEGALPAARILPFRKRKSIVALDLEGDVLRFAQASGGTSPRVNRLGSARLEVSPEKREDAAVLGAAVKGALETMKVSPKDAIFCLPRGQVILRPLQVPMVADVRELSSIINFQIAKDLPFRLEDAVIDFKVLRLVELSPVESATASPEGAPAEGAPAEKRLDVIVGAVRSDLVQFYRDVARNAGLKVAALGLRSVAAAFCAARCISVEPDGALLVVCVRRDETTIEMVVDQKLVFTRAAAISAAPAFDSPEADRTAFLQALEIEVVRSLHSFEGTPLHRPVRKLAVAGGTGLETDICNLLAGRLNVPGAVLDPSSCLDLKKNASSDAAPAVAVIGLAMSALEFGGLPIDFANPKRPAVQRNPRRTQIVVGAVAAFVVLFTLFGIRLNLIKKRMLLRQQVQEQVTDAEKKQLPVYRRLKAQNKVINGWIADDQNWLDHVAYLSAILPAADELFVSTFTTTPQHLLRFSVQARTGELLAELDKKLRAAGYEVRPLSITPANDKNGYNFRTTVELSIPKKMKPDIAKVKPPPRPADDASLKTGRKSS